MIDTVTDLDDWRSGRILRRSERRQGLQHIAEIRAQLADLHGRSSGEAEAGRTGPTEKAREVRHG